MKPLSKWTRLDKVIKRWGGLLFNPDHEELSQFFRFDDLRLYAKGLGFVEYEFIQVIFDNYKEGLRLGWEDSFFRTVYEKVEFGHDDYVPIILKVDLEKDSREGAKQRKCPLAAHSFDTEVDGVALLAKPFDGRITKNIISDTLIELADFYNKGLTEKYSFTPILDERQLYLERENLMRFEQNHLDVPHGLVDAQAEPEKPHCLDSSSEYYAPLLQLCIEAINQENLNDLVHWLYEKVPGARDKKPKARVPESRNLQQLSCVVSNPRALIAFKDGASLQTAYQMTEGIHCGPNQAHRASRRRDQPNNEKP